MHLVSRWVWVAAIALVLGGSTLGAPEGPHRERRSFFDLHCKGVFDNAIFARLDRVCDDCHNLFREPTLYILCRQDCFTSQYFKGCVEVLQETDQVELFKKAECFTTPYFKACVDSLFLSEDEEKLNRMIDYVGKR